MTKHRMGTLRFLLFHICARVIAAPSLNLRAPSSAASSHGDSNLSLNLTQKTANDTILNLLPSSPLTEFSLSSIANSSVEAGLPPDHYTVPTLAGDLVIFGAYTPSPRLSDLTRVVMLATEDAIRHLLQALPPPIPRVLNYQEGFAIMTLRVGPQLSWIRWAWALKVIASFQASVGALSFDFEVSLADFSGWVGIGRVRTYA